jgi:hypothetical protein
VKRSMQWVNMTRDQAADHMGHTHLRRVVGTRAVRSYTHDMEAGRWRGETSPPIVLGPAGEVLDGNHRLSAFLASSLEVFPTWVLTTDDLDSILTIDTGKPRSLADQLLLRGHSHTIELQAMFNTSQTWKGGRKEHQLSRSEAVHWVEANPNAAKGAEIANQVRPGRSEVVRFPIGVVATLYDIACYAEGGDLVEEFAQGATAGTITFPLLSRYQQRMADHTNPRNGFRMRPNTIGFLVARVYLAWVNEETDLTKLFASRKTLEDLGGWYEWMRAMWPSRGGDLSP